MILVDFTQVVISNLMVQMKMHKGEVNEDMIRYMVLNSLRSYQKKYSPEWGELVLCNDAPNTWRKDFFPLYKANRKKSRKNDDKDWGLIFETLNKVKEEIRDNFPYHYLYVEKAEADDIIAVMTKHHHAQRILILSGDKDFQQLQTYPFVKQYSPVLNKWLETDNAENFLKEHILKGDTSDGIPNILSDDNCLDEGIRQKALRSKTFTEYMENGVDKEDKYYRNYKRNETLIDLNFIPENIEQQVLEQFENSNPPKGKVFNYLVKHRLNNLMDNIGDFSL